MESKTIFTIAESEHYIHGRKWINKNTGSAIILIHGIGEHCGRYDAWNQRFNKAGFNVYSFDMPGHGLSQGKRGHIISYNFLFKIIDKVMDMALVDGNNRLILYGHSMGGLIALNYLLNTTHSIQKSIISSPWLGLREDPPGFLVWLSKMINKILPSFSQKTGLKVEHISTLQEEVDKYKADELIHDKITVATFIENQNGIKAVCKKKNQFQIPVHLFHGTDDPITDPAATSRLASMNQNMTYMEIPGLFHELHNEKNNESYFDSIITAIKTES